MSVPRLPRPKYNRLELTPLQSSAAMVSSCAPSYSSTQVVVQSWDPRAMRNDGRGDSCQRRAEHLWDAISRACSITDYAIVALRTGQ